MALSYRVYEHESARTSSHNSSKWDFASFVQFLRYKPLMMAHHLVIALFFIPLMMRHLSDHEPGDLVWAHQNSSNSLHPSHCKWFFFQMIACALVFEASTPFVSLRAILSNMNLKSSLVYLANGFLMVIVFFCCRCACNVAMFGNEKRTILNVLSCRILIFPWFYFVYGRSRGLTVIEAIVSAPYKCSIFMLIVFLPQLHWFRLMVIGAIKVLRERNSFPSVLNNGCIGNKHLWFFRCSIRCNAKVLRSLITIIA